MKRGRQVALSYNHVNSSILGHFGIGTYKGLVIDESVKDEKNDWKLYRKLTDLNDNAAQEKLVNNIN